MNCRMKAIIHDDGLFSHVRNTLFAFAILTLAAHLASAWAMSITINDIPDGVLSATTDLGLSGVVAVPGEVTVTGAFQNQAAGSILPTGVHSVLLTDVSGSVRDFATLTVAAGLPGGPSVVTLLFGSH